MKRAFDLLLAIAATALLALPMLAIAAVVKATSRGPILYWSQRVGRYNKLFSMPKFRSMRIDAPVVATHLLSNPNWWITPVGRVLRVTSLDELPQLWSILTGDMSFVGPRPALFNQEDLIALRTECGVHTLTPGLTGWAQVNGRDECSISEKVEFDREYLLHRTLWQDVQILALTAGKVLRREGIRQAETARTTSAAERRSA